MLIGGADPGTLGDSSMLPTALPLTTEEGAAALFGKDFARAVFAYEGTRWFGPVSSPPPHARDLVLSAAPRDQSMCPAFWSS